MRGTETRKKNAMVLPKEVTIFFLLAPRVETSNIHLESSQQWERGQESDIPSLLEVRRSYRISGRFLFRYDYRFDFSDLSELQVRYATGHHGLHTLRV